tara:strand:+ start:10521 stop:10637 length:117 start_codon:yes stop_codon:yes gene_type:complete
MKNLKDLIGFIEHLKSLNKTKIEIHWVLTKLLEIKEEL